MLVHEGSAGGMGGERGCTRYSCVAVVVGAGGGGGRKNDKVAERHDDIIDSQVLELNESAPAGGRWNYVFGAPTCAYISRTA